ncbi:type IV secretion system protein [Acidovorax sp. CCYZU-2555]|uniref:virB8 family protein n=1 Tax=Acidovorax sp. CCYZU-2555 TaxID=2835042 RepID=UPI001BCEFD55|nr:type IV secretion system protein [Acidovorax sp. CCYZU-2555]MBS7777363.1 type IV secretion system protein [Acidovorax sp. CCYZU-2555]
MFSKNPSTSKIDEAVTHSVNFELTVADLVRRSEKRAWRVAGSSVVMSLVLLSGYFYMLPLKEKVPYLVIADAYTGTSTAARLTDDASLQRITTSEAINRSNVAHFVMAREAYDLALTNLRDWTTVLTMSAPQVAGGYTNLYSAQNPANPYKLYGKDRAVRVRILSITLMGAGAGETPKGATVRFQRSLYDKQSGVTQPLDSKIVTLAFTYKANLKMNEQQRIENPLGFQVTDYRVDNDYASAPPAEIATNARPAESVPAISGMEVPQNANATPNPAGMATAGQPVQTEMPPTPPPPNLGVPGANTPTAPVAPTGVNQGTRNR